MEPCRRVRPWLEWLAADEIDGRRRSRVEAHLRDCGACRRELASWKAWLASAAAPADAEAECRAIDWDAVSGRIMRQLDRAAGTVAAPPRPRVFRFPLLAAAASLLLVFATGLFFWLRQRPPAVSWPQAASVSPAAETRLRSSLAHREVIAYLRQSQLVFTDLLRDCAGEDAAPWEIRLYSRQAKALLLRKKYFQQSLPAAEWLRVRDVSERIDWLNYEILQLDGRQLCGQIGRLQQIMENEKLLLKIRMLERELSLQPFQEA